MRITKHYQLLFAAATAGFWLVWASCVLAMPRESLTIHTRDGALRLNVDIARSESELAQGLMHRERLPPHFGMLFDFKKPQRIQMWMKDTPLPLDMLFIDAKGEVIYLVQSATPNSTKRLGTLDPVRAVLELAGGTITRKRIHLHDTVSHPIFHP